MTFTLAVIEQRVATLCEVARFLHRDPSSLTKLLARHASKRTYAKPGTFHPDKMTEAALRAATAAREKNVAEIQAAGDEIVLNCEGCHRAFKLDLPTEGLATHLARGIITQPAS